MRFRPMVAIATKLCGLAVARHGQILDGDEMHGIFSLACLAPDQCRVKSFAVSGVASAQRAEPHHCRWLRGSRREVHYGRRYDYFAQHDRHKLLLPSSPATSARDVFRTRCDHHSQPHGPGSAVVMREQTGMDPAHADTRAIARISGRSRRACYCYANGRIFAVICFASFTTSSATLCKSRSSLSMRWSLRAKRSATKNSCATALCWQ